MSLALDEAERLARAGDLPGALSEAWRALDAAPDGIGEKRLVARLLQQAPGLAGSDRRAELARLVADPDLDPDHLTQAGWTLLLREGRFAAGAPALEEDPLALRLLEESYVSTLPAELALTALRRDLLLSGAWRDRRRLAEALVRQAGHHGGAWPFEREEAGRLGEAPEFAAAFLPPRPAARTGRHLSGAVTREVAEQYRGWPYPAWSRIAAPDPTTVPEAIAPIDPEGPALPVAATILIAGCGTGREAAILARRFPDARITAIDISETSLAYAEERCAGLGVDFHHLDLHRASELGRFDLISSSGVLHHLADPEAGWAALVAALEPDGVMRIMLYSRVARLRVQAARRHIAGLLGRPVTDSLLREARRRLIERAPDLLSRSLDFYTLGGVHDLLLHRHEDPFDVPRIRRAIEALELKLLAFILPTAAQRSGYRRERPDDPLFRDFDSWSALEKNDPFLFAGMYEFWCRKRAR